MHHTCHLVFLANIHMSAPLKASLHVIPFLSPQMLRSFSEHLLKQSQRINT